MAISLDKINSALDRLDGKGGGNGKDDIVACTQTNYQIVLIHDNGAVDILYTASVPSLFTPFAIFILVFSESDFRSI